jgi:hypothetical protein
MTLLQFAGVTAIAGFSAVVTIPAVSSGHCVSDIFANFRIDLK